MTHRLLAALLLSSLSLLATACASGPHGPRPRVPKGVSPDHVHFSDPVVFEGDVAPDFTLPEADGDGTITLSSFRGRPLVLVFGSYTCNIFAKDVVELRKVWEETHENVQYLMVYVREAHAADERVMKLDMPTVVDTLDDAICRAYSGWPDRLYVLDENGVIVHQSGWGPFDFQPWVMRRILRERFGF